MFKLKLVHTFQQTHLQMEENELIIQPGACVLDENHLLEICHAVPYVRCAWGSNFLLTLVFPLPWTTTGRESYTVFLTLTLSVPNLRRTSSAKKGNKRHYRPGYKNGFSTCARALKVNNIEGNDLPSLHARAVTIFPRVWDLNRRAQGKDHF